jgi:hypothetical protein
VIDQQLPFMPQLRHVVSHVCADKVTGERTLRLVDDVVDLDAEYETGR